MENFYRERKSLDSFKLREEEWISRLGMQLAP